jgi:hypothetical protein
MEIVVAFVAALGALTLIIFAGMLLLWALGWIDV